MWFLGQGANYYIDGVHGNNLYSGRYPNAAKKTLSGIYNRTDYHAGDNIFIVDTITASGNNTLSWNGKAYSEVTLYRYPGGHQCVPDTTGAPSHYEGYDIASNAAFTGPLVEVKSTMEMTGIVLDGFYFESQKPAGEAVGDIEEGGNQYFHTYEPAVAPLVNIANGGRLSVYGQSRLENNYNSSTDGGGVYVANGGVLNLYDGSAVDTNFVATGKNGGGIYVNSTSKVQLSDVVNITGNQQISASKDGEGVDNNVYLSTYDSHVDVGTADTDDPYTMLLSTAKVGITKNPNWGNYYYAPVAYSDGGQAYLGNLVTENAPETGAIMWDDQTKYEILSLNNTHLTPATDYVYFVGTWVTEVTSEPAGFNANEIDTPQELAWAISVASGYNGQTAAPATEFTLTGDIDMSANIWVPIGSNGNAYTGTFNGNGHVVTGLRSPLNQQHMGMFGITNGAHISDLVAQSNFVGGTMQNVGTIIGTMNDGTLSNVEAGGRLTGTNNTLNMGGLVGKVNGDATIHSAFAVDTLTGGTNTVVGGLVGSNAGDLYNSYSNVTLGTNNNATTMAGLVGVNTGTVENCYTVLPEGFGKPAFVHTNQVTEDEETTKGKVNYCYAASDTISYVGFVGAAAPGDLTGHGTYDAVLGRKDLGYLYNDNKVTKVVDSIANPYITENDTIYYDGAKIEKWRGLVSTLNQWVDAHTGYTPWFRPTTGDINGDLPVLGFPKDNSMATEDGKFLHYGSNVDANGLDNLFETFAEKEADMFLYGNATDVAGTNGNNSLFINEDAVLIQSGTNPITATVGITFDNSDRGQHSVDYYGNTLKYDWHMMSSSLQDANIGATYSGSTGYGQNVDIQTLVDSYFPNGLITSSNPAVGGDVKWDLYTYYEPEYHWINLKRSGANHWHEDGNHAQINYQSGQDGLSANQNETIFVPGKGYMMAINQDSYMSSTGSLNNGNVRIRLFKQESQTPAPTDEYNEGWNLVGNPYQAYLKMEALGDLGYKAYTFDADKGVFVPFVMTASDNPDVLADNVHPHQAFFVHADEDGTSLEFTPAMATTEKNDNSYFRANKVNYPLVNLYAENGRGNRDLTVIELNRPELGGVSKMQTMRSANFTIAAHLNDRSYGLVFTPEGTERIPVRFVTDEDGTYTLRWNTQNGEFTSLRLVDNKTGVNYDMLANSSYTFEASADDYASRFYITFNVTNVDENVEASNFAYFNGSEWVVSGTGHLDVVDVTGRILYATQLSGDQNRINLNGLAKGVYLLRVFDNKVVRTQKIIVR